MILNNDWIRFIKPQGGLTSKPRVARIRATLGWGGKDEINPNGVAHCHGVVCNPVGVELLYASVPRVARIRATLGFGVQPPWGCKRRKCHEPDC